MPAARRPLRVTSLLVLVAALAVYAGASATGASATTGSAADFSICSPLANEGDEIFNGLGAFADAGAIARGGTGGEPALNQIHEDLPAQAKGKAGQNFRATVPVHFHVVTDGSIGAVTQAQIDAQIAVLNNTFGGGEGGYNTKFTFVLASVDRTDNAYWFYGSIGGAEHAMKKALHRGGAGALNWYSTTAGPYLGWAYLPSRTRSGPGSTASSSTGSPCSERPRRTRAGTTRARPGRTRSATG